MGWRFRIQALFESGDWARSLLVAPPMARPSRAFHDMNQFAKILGSARTLLAHWAARDGWLRAVVASGAATGTDFLVFLLQIRLGVLAPLAALVSGGAGALVGFAVSRYWTFNAGNGLPRSLLRYAALSVGGALVTAQAVALLVSLMSPTYAWMLARSAVFVGLSYPVGRFWVFGASRTKRFTVASV